MSQLDLVRHAETTLALIRQTELGTNQIYVPPYHWFVAKRAPNGEGCWFIGGVN